MDQATDKQLRLLWDYRGPNAQGIAEHFVNHLKSYAQRHELDEPPMGVLENRPGWWSAYLEAPEADFPELKKHLKPHRVIQVTDE